MKELTIPSTHYPLFKSFIELPKEIKEQIAEHLKLAPLGLSPSSLVDFLSSGIENLSKEKISDVVQIIFNLIKAKERADIPLSDFLEILSNSLENTSIPALRPNDDIMYYFELILSSSDNTSTTAKILDTIQESGKIFLDVKFFQDIRPVFDAVNNLIGSAIISNLKIIFKEDETTKEMFIALDDNDLDNLSNAIKEAQEKNKSIKNHFTDAKIINIK